MTPEQAALAERAAIVAYLESHGMIGIAADIDAEAHYIEVGHAQPRPRFTLSRGAGTGVPTEDRMTLEPLYDRVVLKRKEAEEMSRGGLYVPTAARETSHFAVVEAVGQGRVSENGDVTPLTVEPGQTVLIGKWGGDIVQIDGVEYLVVKEEEILAVVS